MREREREREKERERERERDDREIDTRCDSVKVKRSNILTYLVEGEGFCDGEAPPSFKSTTNHSRTCSGRGRCQTKWIFKLETTHFNTHINRVNWRVELGELWLGGDKETMEGLGEREEREGRR